MCLLMSVKAMFRQRPYDPGRVSQRNSCGGSSYSVISNTEPKVVMPSPWVVPYRFPPAPKITPKTGWVPGSWTKRCNTISFHPPFEFGTSLNTTPQPEKPLPLQ
jgi:hypothetical protein